MLDVLGHGRMEFEDQRPAEVLLQDFIARRVQNLIWPPPYCQVEGVPGVSYL